MSLLGRIRRKIGHLIHPKLGVILMLHRVVEQRSRLSANRQIEITPMFLEQTILEYQRKGYEFVSMDEVVARVHDSSFVFRRSFCRKHCKFVCFTLDDGYKDNYEIAYPIFKKHNVPFCINVTTDFYEGKALLWWYMLEQIGVSEEDFIKYRDLIFKMSSSSIKKAFEDWFPGVHCDWPSLVNELALTSDQIVALSQDPLCTIGSHTVSHPNLSALTLKEQKEEILTAKCKLGNLLGHDVVHFAYPYGFYNDATRFILNKIGIGSAVCTFGGLVRSGCSLHTMPRLELLESETI